MIPEELSERPTCDDCRDDIEDQEIAVSISGYIFHQICWEKMKAETYAGMLGYSKDLVRVIPKTVYEMSFEIKEEETSSASGQTDSGNDYVEGESSA